MRAKFATRDSGRWSLLDSWTRTPASPDSVLVRGGRGVCAVSVCVCPCEVCVCTVWLWVV